MISSEGEAIILTHRNMCSPPSSNTVTASLRKSGEALFFRHISKRPVFSFEVAKKITMPSPIM